MSAWSEKGPECSGAPRSMVVHSLKTYWDQLARIQEGWKQEGQAATHSSVPLHSLAPRPSAQGLLPGTNSIHKSHEEPPGVQWAPSSKAPPHTSSERGLHNLPTQEKEPQSSTAFWKDLSALTPLQNLKVHRTSPGMPKSSLNRPRQAAAASPSAPALRGPSLQTRQITDRCGLHRYRAPEDGKC